MITFNNAHKRKRTGCLRLAEYVGGALPLVICRHIYLYKYVYLHLFVLAMNYFQTPSVPVQVHSTKKNYVYSGLLFRHRLEIFCADIVC